MSLSFAQVGAFNIFRVDSDGRPDKNSFKPNLTTTLLLTLSVKNSKGKEWVVVLGRGKNNDEKDEDIVRTEKVTEPI